MMLMIFEFSLNVFIEFAEFSEVLKDLIFDVIRLIIQVTFVTNEENKEYYYYYYYYYYYHYYLSFE